MDFVNNLPNVDGYDAILTVFCTPSKISHLILCNSTVILRQLANKLFLDNICIPSSWVAKIFYR
jgi:hypothetical protein